MRTTQRIEKQHQSVGKKQVACHISTLICCHAAVVAALWLGVGRERVCVCCVYALCLVVSKALAITSHLFVDFLAVTWVVCVMCTVSHDLTNA